MAGFNYANLVTDIRNYTEGGDSVLTAAIITDLLRMLSLKFFMIYQLMLTDMLVKEH